VVDAKTVAHCQSLVDDALAHGATLLVGGETTQNVLMPAHVVAGVTQDMKLFRDESFGPVVGVIHARDEAHAIELANDTEYGLSAAVFTRDTARGLRVARQIHSGICHVNGPTVHDEAQMPFGGVGASGYGRFGGKAGIDSFTELRWITMETQPGHFRSDFPKQEEHPKGQDHGRRTGRAPKRIPLPSPSRTASPGCVSTGRKSATA
jgi:acyl-CoA reductase-like NAD-dependent aldehyde dehydrogenase